MNTDKRTLLDIISKDVSEMHQKINMHYCMITSILEQEAGEPLVKHLLHNNLPSLRETKLKEEIGEAIKVLEESKKAFKSKRLESLRKRLIQVLVNLE